MRSAQIIVPLFVLATLTVACAPPQPATPAPGPVGEQPKAATVKRIVAAIRGDPGTFNDAINFAATGSSTAGVDTIEQLLHAGLLVVDGKGELRPLLAEAAPTVENGLWKVFPDGRMETSWRLKPNVQWHDGQPLTPEDFLFAATVVQDRVVPMQQDPAFRFVEAIQAPDPRTLLVTWKSPFIDADKLFTQTSLSRNLPMPKHLLESAYLEDKASITQSPAFVAQYVGAGPYRLKGWVPGSHLVMEANEHYVLGRPKIDEIEIRFIPDTNTMMANIIAGALDLSLGRQAVNAEQAIIIREQWKDGVVDAALESTISLHPQFLNPDPPILLDLRLRRALLHALDRQQIVDTFLGGLVPVAHSIISPDQPEYRDIEASIVRYEYDPRRALELLEGLGLTKGPDGIYRDAANRRLSVQVSTRSHPLREKLQQVIADDWRRVGVIAEPSVVPEQRIRDRAYTPERPAFYFRGGDPQQFVDWTSDQVPVAENNYVGTNSIRYKNREYDALIQRFVTTIPRAERMRALGEMVHHATDQLLLLTVFHDPVPALISNRLVNVAGRRGISLQAWNAHLWDVN